MLPANFARRMGPLVCVAGAMFVSPRLAAAEDSDTLNLQPGQQKILQLDPRELKREVDKMLGDRDGLSARIAKDRVMKAEIITANQGQNSQSVLRVCSSKMIELDCEFVEISKSSLDGELPIPIITEDRVYIEYEGYGIRLKITPIADAAGTIQTKVLTEISQVDQATTVQGVPGPTTRRVQTEVTVRDGDTIVPSGLLYLTEGKDVTKVPILGHIPIIGELFKSRQFRDSQTELVVFVTPRLVDPLANSQRELSTQILNKYKDAEDDVGFGLLD